jgi:hyaluronoglucosaminidase
MKKINRKTTSVCETGVVEGFFGKPWSLAARLRVIEFMGAAGLQSYIYAPKDDIYHRMNWTTPYPPAEWRRVSQVIRSCKKNGVRFIWAVSPGMTMHYCRAADLDILVEKFERPIPDGVSSFCLFLDDIPPELVHEDDRKAFSSLGEAHAHVCNRLFERLSAKVDGARLWMCPTDYATVSPTPYLLTIGKLLRPEVGVFWTGPKVVSPGIAVEHAKAFAKIIRRKPLLWDNYPVNDYNRHKLNMGPLRGRDPGLTSMLAGYFTNPMNEASASMIPILTIADYLYNPAGYDPDDAERNAIVRIAGKRGEAALADFCDAWPAGFFPGEPKTALQKAVERARDGKADELIPMLERLAALQESMKSEPELKFIYPDAAPFLKGLSLYSKAALLVLKLKDNPSDIALRSSFKRAFIKAERTKMQPGGGHLLRKFINDIYALT